MGALLEQSRHIRIGVSRVYLSKINYLRYLIHEGFNLISTVSKTLEGLGYSFLFIFLSEIGDKVI
jgi:putative Ca2+/H+ antiporter (TMEM165/GDT1 family)